MSSREVILPSLSKACSSTAVAVNSRTAASFKIYRFNFLSVKFGNLKKSLIT